MNTSKQRIVGRGIYSLRDASQLTGIPAARVRRWVEGYRFRSGGEVRSSGPLFRHDYGVAAEGVWLSFADLVEVRFIDAFVRAGVSLNAVRVAAERASELLSQDHPFSSREFKTDGRTIMTELAQDSKAPELLDLVSNQVGFKKLIDPFLYRGLDFGPKNSVARWWHHGGQGKIVIDPTIAFGRPVVAKESVPSRALFEAFRVEKSVERVSEIFEVSKPGVSAAIQFERQLAA